MLSNCPDEIFSFRPKMYHLMARKYTFCVKNEWGESCKSCETSGT